MDTLSAKQAVADGIPEFAKILDSFMDELHKAENLKYSLMNISRNLKLQPESPCINDPKSKEPESITEHLWTRVWRLRDINNENELTINHLREIIGS